MTSLLLSVIESDGAAGTSLARRGIIGISLIFDESDAVLSSLDASVFEHHEKTKDTDSDKDNTDDDSGRDHSLQALSNLFRRHIDILCWMRHFVIAMRSHERRDKRGQHEACKCPDSKKNGVSFEAASSGSAASLLELIV